jgi:hypothetical protein
MHLFDRLQRWSWYGNINRSLNSSTGNQPWLSIPYLIILLSYQIHRTLWVPAKSKAIPVTGHEGPQGCEMSRLPHLLDNQLTEGSKVVSLTCRPPITPQEDSWYSFLLGWVNPRPIMQLEGLGNLKNSDDLIRNRTRDLPACSIVTQPNMLPCAPNFLF